MFAKRRIRYVRSSDVPDMDIKIKIKRATERKQDWPTSIFSQTTSIRHQEERLRESTAKCFDLLSNSLNFLCKKMYGEQSGEF